MPHVHPERYPAILVAIGPGFDRYMSIRGAVDVRDYALDSGAFVAMQQRKTIDVAGWIANVRRIMQTDRLCAEVFALDVIGDARASMRNYRLIAAAGIDAIPTYHYGEPVDVLDELARAYPKIALGGCARIPSVKQRLDFAERCLQRIWPKRVHGLGYSTVGLERVPFHSVDASTWQYNTSFGNYQSLRAKGLSSRGVVRYRNLRIEVDYNLRREAELRERWHATMAEIDAAGTSPTVRLVVSNGNVVERAALMDDRVAACRLLREGNGISDGQRAAAEGA